MLIFKNNTSRIKSKSLLFSGTVLLVVFIVVFGGSVPYAAAFSAPSCSFDAQDGRTVVNFNTSLKLFSSRSASKAQTNPVSTSIKTGTYTVSLMSWDAYKSRVNKTQSKEQWFARLMSSSTEVARSSAISDLADTVQEAVLSEVVDDKLVIGGNVNAVIAFHDAYPDTSSANSLTAVCAAFDLVEEEGGGGGTSTGTGGGGGGGPMNIVPLEVFSEEVTWTNVVTTTAVIEWDSNLLSTSRVIYGKESDGPYSLNLTVLPNFGYPLSTVEDPAKVIHHVVTLTGLEVGVTYVYRVVSRASPPTVGFQQTFALVEGEDGSSVSDAPVGGYTPPSGGTGGSPTGETGGTGEEAPVGSPEVQGAEESSTEASLADGTQAAALGLLTLPDDFFGWLKCFGLFLLFVVLIYVAWTLWRDRNKSNYTKDELSKRGTLLFFVGSLLSIFVAYLLGWDCTIIPLIVLAIISLVLYLLDLFTNRNR